MKHKYEVGSTTKGRVIFRVHSADVDITINESMSIEDARTIRDLFTAMIDDIQSPGLRDSYSTGPDAADRQEMADDYKTAHLLIHRAMRDTDLVIRFTYIDGKKKVTSRLVSPYKWINTDMQSFSGLCLTKQDIRQFKLSQMGPVTIVKASEIVAPVTEETIAAMASPSEDPYHG